MSSLGVIFVGFIIVFPHVFYSCRDLFWPKGKKIEKNRGNLLWNLGAGTLELLLLAVLTFESFTNEFSLLWIFCISSFLAVLLIWSVTFMRGAGKDPA